MSKTRGRPTKEIKWPEGSFTPKQAIEYNESRGSVGLLHLIIKKAMLDGSLTEVGKIKPPKGRPASLYSKS